MVKFILAGLFLCSLFAIGQSLNNFNSLQSGGPIPVDFTTLSSEKFEIDYAENLDEELGKEFFLSTRFYIDELLLSGLILFNEPVSNFVNSVADTVLRNEPALRKELRFYVLKSNVVNAFSTDQGIIIITIGLLTHLQNESQLAFVIAHEIAHYQEKHVRSGYIEYVKSQDSKSDYKQMTDDMRIRKLSQYSREMEFAADELGIKRFLESGYNQSEIVPTLKMLEKADQPFAELTLDTTFLNTIHLVVPGTYFYKESLIKSSQQNNVDHEYSTHPKIADRINKAIETLGIDSSEVVKPNDPKFKLIQNLARFETINIDLLNRDYINAIYTCFVLNKEFPENQFIDFSIVKCLYGISKYANYFRLNEIPTYENGPNDCRGQLSSFFTELSRSQITVIAYRYAYDLSNKFPENSIYKMYEQDLKKELATNCGLAIYQLTSERFVVSGETLVKIDKSNPKIEIYKPKDYKIDQPKDRFEKPSLTTTKKFDFSTTEETKQIEITDPNANFHLHAFPDLVSIGFRDELAELKTIRDLNKGNTAVYTKKDYKRDMRVGKSLGLDSLVVFDPIVNILNAKKNVNLLKSEKQKVSVQSAYDLYTDKKKNNGMEVFLVDSKNLKESDINEYRNLAIMKQWIFELFETSDMNMIPSTQNEIQTVTDYYGTNHFLFSLAEIRKDRPRPTWVHFLGFMGVATLPVVLLDLILIQNYLGLVSIVINPLTLETEFVQVLDVEVYGKEYTINNYLHDVLYQLSKDPKSK